MELIFEGAYYWREFCVSKWVGFDNKNSLKHQENSLKQLKTSNPNSPWAYFREGLLSERYYFASEIWGTYFREGLFSAGLIIGIFRYLGDMLLLKTIAGLFSKADENRSFWEVCAWLLKLRGLVQMLLLWIVTG